MPDHMYEQYGDPAFQERHGDSWQRLDPAVYGPPPRWREQDPNRKLSFGLGLYSGVGPEGYRRSDERVREDICERMMAHPRLDASGLSVEVKDGVVHLSGRVPSRDSRWLAEELADSVAGVMDVHNRLKVQPATGSSSPG